jgi:WD40 repeat protein
LFVVVAVFSAAVLHILCLAHKSDHSVFVFSGQVLSSSCVQVSTEGINCVEFSARSDALLYIGCNDGCVRLLDLNRMSVISSSFSSPSPCSDEPPVIHTLAALPSGVLAGDGDGVVKCWGVAEGGSLVLRATQQLHGDAVGDLKVSSSGCVATCSMDGSGVHTWMLSMT